MGFVRICNAVNIHRLHTSWIELPLCFLREMEVVEFLEAVEEKHKEAQKMSEEEKVVAPAVEEEIGRASCRERV